MTSNNFSTLHPKETKRRRYGMEADNWFVDASVGLETQDGPDEQAIEVILTYLDKAENEHDLLTIPLSKALASRFEGDVEALELGFTNALKASLKAASQAGIKFESWYKRWSSAEPIATFHVHTAHGQSILDVFAVLRSVDASVQASCVRNVYSMDQFFVDVPSENERETIQQEPAIVTNGETVCVVNAGIGIQSMIEQTPSEVK